MALARLLTQVESGGADGRAAAALAYRSGVEADTVGITGAPGAGKSTLVDRLIATARAGGVAQLGRAGRRPVVAVLGRRHPRATGSGCRTTPSTPASSSARWRRAAIWVGWPWPCPRPSASWPPPGFPLVLVETVGVGQVEVEVAGATDTTVVVLNPKWGDAVQANKAGLLETADIFVINKADMPGARETRRDLEQMLDLTAPGGLATAGARDDRPPPARAWTSCGTRSARHQRHLEDSGALERGRAERLEREFRSVLAARIETEIDGSSADGEFAELVRAVAEHRLDPYDAAERLLAHVDGTTGRRRTGRLRAVIGQPDAAVSARPRTADAGRVGYGARMVGRRTLRRSGVGGGVVAVDRRARRGGARHARPAQDERAVGGVARPPARRRSPSLAADPPGAVVLWGGQRIFAAGADVERVLRARTPRRASPARSTPPPRRSRRCPA